MAKSLVEAAVNGPAGSNRAYFFRGDQFVTYDWGQDRATLGAKSIADDWGLPNTFQPPRFDAAVSGREGGGAAHLQHAYFFRGPEYIRHDWTSPTPRPFEFVDTLDGWKLQPPFTDGVEAAFNGKGTRAGKTYFFKGGNYARYSWAGDVLDYVRQISLIAPGTMPADFAAGVDAAVDGDGAFANYGYLFKGDRYIRFNWGTPTVEPFVEGGPVPIVGHWHGLAELLLAGEAKSKAFEWLWAALPQLTAYIAAVRAHVPYPDAPFIEGALLAHFRIDPATAEATRLGQLDAVAANLRAIEAALHRAPAIFRYRTEEENRQDGRVIIQRDAAGQPVLDATGQTIPVLDAEGKPQPDTAAYTRHAQDITFTRDYPTRGEACRAAQIIHEAGHFVDPNNGAPNDVPEWYVTPALAATLGLTPQGDIPATEVVSRYDLMTAAVASHNPSSYAAFAQHLRYRADTRYGELRQQPLPGLW